MRWTLSVVLTGRRVPVNKLESMIDGVKLRNGMGNRGCICCAIWIMYNGR